MGVTFPRAWLLLALSSVAAACYDKPDDQQGGTEADGSSTGASTTMSMTSVDASSESGSTSPTTTSGMTTMATESTDPMTESGSTAPADSGSESGTVACDVLADDCAGGTLCDGQACVDPPDGSVAVPGGAFMMGCNEDVDTMCADDEYPYHEVTLSSFAIDQTEVTVAAWNECVGAGACPSLPAIDAGGNACTFPSDDHPVACVDWFQASAYCEWRGGALPTEAQWEKAARGDDGRIYPWGNEASTCTLANTSDCAGSATLEVGSKPAGASPYGALDMTGNVAEWCADWYSASYYVSSPDQDPLGPGSGTRRVARSSAPNYGAAHASSRWAGEFDVPTPESSHVNVGLRCAYVPTAR